MNVLLLEMRMKQSGCSNEDMAKRLQIDPATFYRKKKGDSDFTRRELQAIKAKLSLSQEDVEEIFFTE